MPRDFRKLANDSLEERNKIIHSENSQPVRYGRKLLDNLDDYFTSQLFLMSEEAEEAEKDFQSQQSGSEYQRDFFTQLHHIRRYRERVHSDDIPIELYHLIEQVIDDLDPSQSFYVLSTGLRVKQNRLDSLLYFTAENLKRYEDRDEYTDLKQNPIMIQLPRNELESPFTYCLIPHEIFHNMSIKEELVENFNYVNRDISESEKEELCVDSLTLNYMGPAYALSLIKLYEKVEEESISDYPPIETRISYFLEHLQYMKDYVDYFPYKDVIDTVISIIAERRGERTSDYVISDVREFDSHVVSKMKDNDIPVFNNQYHQLRNSLQVSELEPGRLKKIINPLLDISEDTNEIQPVAIPVHPVLLFNLIVLLSDLQADKKLQTGVLSSLRKWHVRKHYESN